MAARFPSPAASWAGWARQELPAASIGLLDFVAGEPAFSAACRVIVVRGRTGKVAMDPTHTGAQIAEPVGEAVAVAPSRFQRDVLIPIRSLDLRGIRLVMRAGGGGQPGREHPVHRAGVLAGGRVLRAGRRCCSISPCAQPRAGRAYEQIVIGPLELMLRKVPVRGRPCEWRFNPVWTRLHREVTRSSAFSGSRSYRAG